MLRQGLTVLGALALATTLAAARHAQASDAPQSRGDGRFEVAQACGWYAVFQCAKNPNLGGPGYVIVTNNFPNFRPGWYCKVLGPFGSQGEAAQMARRYGGYAKSGC